MAGGIVNIILRSVSQGSGFKDHIDGAKRLTTEISGLSNAAQILGTAFGTVGSAFGAFVRQFLTGGIWAAGAFLFKALWKAHEDAQAKATEEAKRKTEEMIAANSKLVASIKEASTAQAAAIDHSLSRREKEIDRVKELTKAEIELARQREIAAAKGDEGKISAANTKAEKLLSSVDAEAAAQKIAERMAAAEEKVLQRRADANMAGHAWEVAEATNQELKRRFLTAQERYAEQAVAATRKFGANGMVFEASDRQKAEVAALARGRFAETEEGRALSKEISDHADGALKEARKALDEANAAVRTAEEARQDASDSAALFIKNRQVAVVKQSNAESTAAKKAADERQKAEVAAAQAAAKERERLDREAHQKRMTDLRAEMAEQQKQAAAASAKMTQIQSEFDKAFAMYRDPAQAAAVIGEEQDYRNDLDQLHKDARRYGGRWRIDRLSALMAAGDTQGVSDALADWRKNKGFTPEVEAMVRASAAENAKTTVEDELRKIEKNTADLAAKLEDLLSMKGGT